MRQWAWTQLEVHYLRFCLCPAFLMPNRDCRVGRPQAAALPARLRIIDAPIQQTGAETRWVRNRQAPLQPCYPVATGNPLILRTYCDRTERASPSSRKASSVLALGPEMNRQLD
jgi:hypothetical protein